MEVCNGVHACVSTRVCAGVCKNAGVAACDGAHARGLHTRVAVCTWVCTCGRVHACRCVWECTCAGVHVWAGLHMCWCAHVCRCAGVHTHVQVCTRVQLCTFQQQCLRVGVQTSGCTCVCWCTRVAAHACVAVLMVLHACGTEGSTRSRAHVCGMCLCAAAPVCTRVPACVTVPVQGSTRVGGGHTDTCVRLLNPRTRVPVYTRVQA